MQVSGVTQSPDQAGALSGHQKHPPMSEETMTAVAKKLGMSEDDLKSSLSSGKTLRDIAKDKGVSETDLRDTIRGSQGNKAHGAHKHHGGGGGKQMADALASNLGISADDLQSAFKSPDGLNSLLQKTGITEDQFHAAVAKTFSSGGDSSKQGTVIDTAA